MTKTNAMRLLDAAGIPYRTLSPGRCASGAALHR